VGDGNYFLLAYIVVKIVLMQVFLNWDFLLVKWH